MLFHYLLTFVLLDLFNFFSTLPKLLIRTMSTTVFRADTTLPSSVQAEENRHLSCELHEYFSVDRYLFLLLPLHSFIILTVDFCVVLVFFVGREWVFILNSFPLHHLDTITTLSTLFLLLLLKENNIVFSIVYGELFLFLFFNFLRIGFCYFMLVFVLKNESRLVGLKVESSP